jgi:hypothetical protein
VHPGVSALTPSGVPVKIRSPGSSVMQALMYSSRYGTSNTMSASAASCLRTPSTPPRMRSAAAGSGSPGAVIRIHGPTGPKPSKPLARVHCLSRFCRSRLLMSLPSV